MDDVWDSDGWTVIRDDGHGQEMLLAPTHRQATIGRIADFVVGASDNHVHRHFLTIWNTGAGWALKNEGRFLSATVAPVPADDDEGDESAPVVLESGDSLVLVPGDTAITFTTPEADYAFTVRMRSAPASA